MTRTDVTPHARLDISNVARFLADQGVIDSSDETVSVKVLSGGVSSDVFAVRTDEHAWVVKQALPQLKVAQKWEAAPDRILTEARALEVASGILGDHVPHVQLVDSKRFVLVQELAPPELIEWRSALMNGGDNADVKTAQTLGECLAALHGSTKTDNSLTRDFGNTSAFIELRVSPFYRAAAVAVPEAAPRLNELALRLLTEQACLVHGDFSPKNVLADGSRLWILDWEVAHMGSPAFDVAFLICHLICKAIHRPELRLHYQNCAEAFADSYFEHMTPEICPTSSEVAAHASALVLARAVGKSPATYLTAAQRDTARVLSLVWLSDPTTDLHTIWSDHDNRIRHR